MLSSVTLHYIHFLIFIIIIMIIIISFFCCSFIVTPYNHRRDGVDNANYLRVCLRLWTSVSKNNFWVIGSLYILFV